MKAALVQRRSIHATGFIVLDLLVADGRMTPTVGGDGSERCRSPLSSWLGKPVTALLGNDRAGMEVVRQLTEYGVDTSGVVLEPGARTPVLIHEVFRGRHRFRFSCPHCGAKYAKYRPLPPDKSSVAPEASVHFFDRASSSATRLAEAVKSVRSSCSSPGLREDLRRRRPWRHRATCFGFRRNLASKRALRLSHLKSKLWVWEVRVSGSGSRGPPIGRTFQAKSAPLW